MNKEQQELLDDVYQNYTKNVNEIIDAYKCGDMIGTQPHIEKMFSNPDDLTPLTKEEYINKCKTDLEFSEKWGLTIEERELSLKERVDYKKKRDGIARTFAPYTHKMLDGSNIPTKLITVTYNNETIVSYGYKRPNRIIT